MIIRKKRKNKRFFGEILHSNPKKRKGTHRLLLTFLILIYCFLVTKKEKTAVKCKYNFAKQPFSLRY